MLCILFANIWSFASPAWNSYFGSVHFNGQDRVTEVILQIFVNGKFRSMLAMIFGAGVSLQYLKRKGQAGAWPGGYVKRSGYLALIGLVHGFFIWFGDILSCYGVTSAASVLLVSRPRARKIYMWVAGALVVLVGVLMALSEGSSKSSVMPTPAGMSAAGEFAAFSGVNLLDQLKYRSTLYGILLFIGPFLVIDLLVLFCGGMVLFESGVLSKPGANLVLSRKLLATGFGGGGLMTVIGVGVGSETFVELVAAPLVALGYLVGGAILVERFSTSKLIAGITKVGKTALTVYLLQSAFATFIFYGWGLGWYGKFTLTTVMAVVPVIWLFVVSFALVWQKFFILGPVEWLLRSLTEGERLPIRRT